MWDLSSVTRDRTRVPCVGSGESPVVGLSSHMSVLWTQMFSLTWGLVTRGCALSGSLLRQRGLKRPRGQGCPQGHRLLFWKRPEEGAGCRLPPTYIRESPPEGYPNCLGSLLFLFREQQGPEPAMLNEGTICALETRLWGDTI